MDVLRAVKKIAGKGCTEHVWRQFQIRVESGFGMLEVLVALLITSVAVFGMSAFLLGTMQDAREAALRAQAGFYLTDMLERIRANPEASYATDFGQKPSLSGGCEESLCSPTLMAGYEVAQWKCALGGAASPVCAAEAAMADVLSLCEALGFKRACLALPEGDGQIRAISGGYEISVRWQPLRATADEYDEISLSTLL